MTWFWEDLSSLDFSTPFFEHLWSVVFVRLLPRQISRLWLASCSPVASFHQWFRKWIRWLWEVPFPAWSWSQVASATVSCIMQWPVWQLGQIREGEELENAMKRGLCFAVKRMTDMIWLLILALLKQKDINKTIATIISTNCRHQNNRAMGALARPQGPQVVLKQQQTPSVLAILAFRSHFSFSLSSINVQAWISILIHFGTLMRHGYQDILGRQCCCHLCRMCWGCSLSQRDSGAL